MPSPRGALAGRLLVVLAAVLWSTGGAFAKAPVFDDWPPEQRGLVMAFWRALFAGLCLAPLVRRPRVSLLLVPMTLAFAAMNVTYLVAMSYTTAANVIWLQMTSPIWVFLFAAVVLREPAGRRDWVLLAFAMAGVGTILWFEMQSPSRIGVALALASGGLYATVVLFVRRLRAEDSAWLATLNLLVTAAVLLPYMLVDGRWPTGGQWPTLVAFGFLQIGLPYVLFAQALRRISSQEAAGIGLLEPILLPVWVYLIWGERTSNWTLAGASLILAGLLLRYLPTLGQIKAKGRRRKVKGE